MNSVERATSRDVDIFFGFCLIIDHFIVISLSWIYCFGQKIVKFLSDWVEHTSNRGIGFSFFTSY